MVDKSALRSNKPDSSTSSNGEKAPSSQPTSTASSQGKLTPARTPSSKAQATTAKAGGANNVTGTTAEKSARTNGVDPNEPFENRVNGTTIDVAMGEDPPDPVDKSKAEGARGGDEEMTVVVPPAKGPKLSAEPEDDHGGDVTMQNADETDGQASVDEVDPVAKAVAGQS